MNEDPGSDPSEEAQGTVDDLSDHGDKLEKDIKETKADWESKQQAADVPGALPDPDDDPLDDQERPADDD